MTPRDKAEKDDDSDALEELDFDKIGFVSDQDNGINEPDVPPAPSLTPRCDEEDIQRPKPADLPDEIKHTRGSWASGWGPRRT